MADVGTIQAMLSRCTPLVQRKVDPVEISTMATEWHRNFGATPIAELDAAVDAWIDSKGEGSRAPTLPWPREIWAILSRAREDRSSAQEPRRSTGGVARPADVRKFLAWALSPGPKGRAAIQERMAQLPPADHVATEVCPGPSPGVRCIGGMCSVGESRWDAAHELIDRRPAYPCKRCNTDAFYRWVEHHGLGTLEVDA